jgi:hypothetical protein
MRVVSTSSFIGLIATLFTATAIAQADKATDLLSACPLAKGDSITKVKEPFWAAN